jgi:hypothetical protein
MRVLQFAARQCRNSTIKKHVMGWIDYIANQSGQAVEFTRYDGFSGTQYKLQPGENKSFGRGGMCLFSVNFTPGGSREITSGENRCQNWEFLLGPGGKIVRADGYAGRPPGPIQQQYPESGSALSHAFIGTAAEAPDYSEQRAAGSAMAIAEGAPKTAAAIQSGACFKDILATAASEVGHAKLISGLLNGPAEWAHQALLYLDLPKNDRQALSAKLKAAKSASGPV